jgi:uncharacterized protein (TIGR02597 family)
MCGGTPMHQPTHHSAAVRCALWGLLLSTFAGPVLGERFQSPPAGVFPIAMRAGADTAVGLPLERGAVFSGRLEAVEGSTLTLAADPGWAPDSLAGVNPKGEYHYCLVVSGALEGARFPILANGSRTLTLASEGEDLSLLRLGDASGPADAVRILPFWTPETVFAFTGLPAGARLLIFDSEGPGLRRSPCVVLHFAGEAGWVDAAGAPAEAYPLRHGHGFFVRLPSGANDLPLQLVGFAPVTRERYVFSGWAGAAGSDRLFALGQPEPIVLADSGLDFTNFTKVFAYDGDQSSVEAPAAVYTYLEGFGWFDERYRPVGDLALLRPGFAYFVRIPAVAEDCEWVWDRQPTYLDYL